MPVQKLQPFEQTGPARFLLDTGSQIFGERHAARDEGPCKSSTPAGARPGPAFTQTRPANEIHVGGLMAGTASSGGRNKKSAQQHRLQGTYRKSRHATAADPKAPEGVPVPPKALSGDALAEWHRMIARMQACQTLALVDDAVIYQYVQLFAEAEALVASNRRWVL